MKFDKPFLTINDLVKLGMSRDELKALVRREDFPSFKLNPDSKTGTWLIDPDDFEKWLKQKNKGMKKRC